MALSSGMMFTDLSYVQDKLKGLGHARWADVARAARVPIRTIKRVAYNENKAYRSDTIGKLAIYFRTKDKRKA